MTEVEPFRRRHFLAVLAVAPLGLVGCQLVRNEPIPTTQAEEDTFPVTVQHAFGETVISSEPLRIANLDLASSDTCLALGVVPLAMPLSDALPNGSTPWFDAAWKRFGVTLPLLLDGSKGFPVEELAAMSPDLILAVNGRLSRAQYDELSKIAPVVASPGDSSVPDWRSSLALVAKAIGRTGAAGNVRSATEASIAGELQNYPGLAGTTFIAVKARSAVGADFEVMKAQSNPVRMLEEWGLRLAPVSAVIEREGRDLSSTSFGSASYSWPHSRGNELSSDIAIISVLHREADQLEAGYLETIPAFVNGAYLIADDKDGALALETGSCLSTQWLSRTMLPQVAKSAFRARQGS